MARIPFEPVLVVATTNVDFNGGAPDEMDGVQLFGGARVLLAGQTDAKENGPYKVRTLGSGANGTWTRTRDANTNSKLRPNSTVWVKEGDTYADSWWVVTSDSVDLGVTDIVWEQDGAGAAEARTYASGDFGDGSDGAVDFDGVNTFAFATKNGNTYTLTNDVYATDITVANGVTVVTGSVASGVYAMHFTGTLTNNGTIHADGDHAGVPGGHGANIGGTAIPSSGTRLGSYAGKDAAGAGNGVAGTTATDSIGGSGGGRTTTEGNSGSGGNTGGAPGTCSWSVGKEGWRGPAAKHGYAFSANNAVIGFVGGGGGASGAGDTTTAAGGGGGGGGGVVYLLGRKVVNSGTIRAKGGNGAQNTFGGNPGGGSGGGGGAIVAVVDEWTGTVPVAATACTGGAAGAGFGSGVAGAAGSDGNVLILQNKAA